MEIPQKIGLSLNDFNQKEKKIPVIWLCVGSFNPITIMHLRLFEMKHDPDEIIVAKIISPVNDCYKKPGLISSHHRIKMCELAVQGTDIVVDGWEATRDSYQTTFNVLNHVKETYKCKLGYDPVVRIICGSDLVESFTIEGLWNLGDLDRILSKEFGVQMLIRENISLEDLTKKSDILRHYKEHIHVDNSISINLCSTQIRNSIKNRQSIKYLTTNKVIEYIEHNKLYIEKS